MFGWGSEQPIQPEETSLDFKMGNPDLELEGTSRARSPENRFGPNIAWQFEAQKILYTLMRRTTFKDHAAMDRLVHAWGKLALETAWKLKNCICTGARNSI